MNKEPDRCRWHHVMRGTLKLRVCIDRGGRPLVYFVGRGFGLRIDDRRSLRRLANEILGALEKTKGR